MVNMHTLAIVSGSYFLIYLPISAFIIRKEPYPSPIKAASTHITIYITLMLFFQALRSLLLRTSEDNTKDFEDFFAVLSA